MRGLPKIESLDIIFDNPDGVYFAGQELAGKVVLKLKEAKKINEVLLELKGRARTYWTKHSGKSRKHCSDSEPYFCEQFNTNYTHKFATKKGKETEFILPPDTHEIPFSFTLPKTIPSSFEGDFGYVRYSCRVTLERPWDFDIVAKRAFSVIGIEDINEDTKALDPVKLTDSNFNIRYCCRPQGTITVNVFLPRTGYAPGETVVIDAEVQNDSQKTLRYSMARIKQHTCYRAKTFAGHEHTKQTTKVICKKERNEIAPQTNFKWTGEALVIPPVPPKLQRCRIIDVSYTLEFEVDPGIVVISQLIIGTIPLVPSARLASHLRSAQNNAACNDNDQDTSINTTMNENTPMIQVTVPDDDVNASSTSEAQIDSPESKDKDINGAPPDNGATEDLSNAEDGAAYSKKRVRMPSTVLSELYPELRTPTFDESFFGKVDISEDKETVQYGELKFAPRYPCYYKEMADIPPTIRETPTEEHAT